MASPENIYLLGSKITGIESVVIENRQAMQLTSFETLEQAKANFIKAYDLLLAPTFTPSLPPSKEEIAYHRGFMRLATFYPVILQLPRSVYLEEFSKWRHAEIPLFQTQEKFYGDLDYWHCAMRTGFFKTYLVLDVVHDIESTPFIGPNGKMVIRINQFSSDPDQPLMPLTDQQIREHLRKRGYL